MTIMSMEKLQARQKRNRIKNKKYQKKYYESNKASNIIWKKNNHNKWIEFLTSLGYGVCTKCGYDKCWSALDFHHRDPDTKGYSVSRFIRRKKLNIKNIKKAFEEIDKCDVLCANCHRELHYNSNNY